MTPYLEMNSLLRNSICFWAILLFAGFVMSAVHSLIQKKYLYAGVIFLPVLGSYCIMQICRSISCSKMGSDLHPLAASAGNIPYWIYLAVLFGLTLVVLLCFWLNTAYAESHITPMAVKEAVDQNPTGICFYRSNGQVVLINHRMNALAFTVTGRALLNGAEFYEAVCNRHIAELPDGSVIRFSHRSFMLNGEPCHELIADDITELYRKTETLRKENEYLKIQNQRMREYGKTIDDTVRRQEILHTKTRIHAEMNRLLISTDNAIRCGTEQEKQKITETWQKNVLLLCIEADTSPKTNVLSDLEALSGMIGLSIVYDSIPVTDDKNALYLFFLSAEEAMTNAAKHANAKHLYVHVTENETSLSVTFTNDGKVPEGPLTEGSGLSALRHRLEQAGGVLQTASQNQFMLSVMIPKGDN